MTNPFDPTSAPNAVPSVVTQNTFAHWRDKDAVTTDAAFAHFFEFRRSDDKSPGTVYRHNADANGYCSVPAVKWPIGSYVWHLYISRVEDGAKFLVKTGTVRVSPDVASGVDPRPHAIVMVAKIEALLENRADSDVESYTIGGRSIAKMPAAELLKWRDHYRAEAAALKAEDDRANGRRPKNYILARF